MPIIVSIDDNSSIWNDLKNYIIKDLDYDNEKIIIQTSNIDINTDDVQFTILYTQFSRGLSGLSQGQDYRLNDSLQKQVQKFSKQSLSYSKIESVKTKYHLSPISIKIIP